MNENINISEAVDKIKESNEDQLQETIREWFNKTHTQGLKLGAHMMSAVIYDVIQKNVVKQQEVKQKVSYRDYERCVNEIMKIISVQLKQNETQQNDKENFDEQESSI